MRKVNIKETIHAKGIEIGIYTTDFENEYISLTDIARYRSSDPRITIHSWLRSRDIIEFLGLWEVLHNPDFKRSEFDTFKTDAGTNAFTFSIKDWNENLCGKGIITKSGRYGGGIYAHSDIALEFASWLSPEFKLYIIKDYKRLKNDENSRLSLNWNLNRELTKLNYRIHTDAIKENLILPELTAAQKSFVYADEADLLNVGRSLTRTYRVFARKNSQAQFASLRSKLGKQPKVATNMENLNAVFINDGMPQSERLEKLNKIAIQQMKVLENVEDRKLLAEGK